MPKFLITHDQAVWEQTVAEVEADSLEDAEERAEELLGEAILNKTAIIEVHDTVFGISSEFKIKEIK